ncbi:hypothetical protein AeRB84_017962 [Aphanomyces euteiches]|nr:hypothetical protein AeRB84_017962 [Aphanomyces euteiches]
MHNLVHVDEKWFYVTKVKRKVYAFADETLAMRHAKSKSFVTKVMFLAAIARPRYDHHRRTFFDGKLGIWPFVECTLAKRTSKNRPKGTPVLSPQSVTAEAYREMMLQKVFPAINARMPSVDRNQCILIQQDNASAHGAMTTKFLKSIGTTSVQEEMEQQHSSLKMNVC